MGASHVKMVFFLDARTERTADGAEQSVSAGSNPAFPELENSRICCSGPLAVSPSTQMDKTPPRHGQSCHVATGSRLRRQELGFYCNNSPNLVKGQQFISSLSLPRREEFSTLCSSTMRFMADCAKSCSRELDCLLMLPVGLGQPSCLST